MPSINTPATSRSSGSRKTSNPADTRTVEDRPSAPTIIRALISSCAPVLSHDDGGRSARPYLGDGNAAPHTGPGACRRIQQGFLHRRMVKRETRELLGRRLRHITMRHQHRAGKEVHKWNFMRHSVRGANCRCQAFELRPHPTAS